MNDLDCPYCGAELEVCHDDGQGYEEDVAHEMECAECRKTFVFHTHMSFDYYAERADCLNGQPHPFGDWQILWRNKKEGLMTESRTCRTCCAKRDDTARRVWFSRG